MKAIGGYFELELEKGNSVYHPTPYGFKSGRSALHFILKSCKPDLVYLPFYTCHALLEPLQLAGVRYRFYSINQKLEPETLPELEANEYFLYINYFDLKRKTVNALAQKYGEHLIVDATQAFFQKGNGTSWLFNSCRKFFGVPDGAYLYAPDNNNLASISDANEAYKVDHLIQRFNSHVQDGYPLFCENETLCDSEIKGISKLTEHLLSHVDYDAVAQKRKQNFYYLHQSLGQLNRLEIDTELDGVPQFYPLFTNKPFDREQLYNQQLFIPTFWQSVIENEDNHSTFEKTLASQLLPLPVDHRYTTDDMKNICTTIKTIL